MEKILFVLDPITTAPSSTTSLEEGVTVEDKNKNNNTMETTATKEKRTHNFRRFVRSTPLEIGRKISSKNPPSKLNGIYSTKVISKQHAIITQEEGQFLITDLGSSNGTFVNDSRLQPQEKYPLRHRDHITLGVDIVDERGRVEHSHVDIQFLLGSELDPEILEEYEEVCKAQSSSRQGTAASTPASNTKEPKESSTLLIKSILENELETQRQTHSQLSKLEQITSSDPQLINDAEIQKELKKLQIQQLQQKTNLVENNNNAVVSNDHDQPITIALNSTNDDNNSKPQQQQHPQPLVSDFGVPLDSTTTSISQQKTIEEFKNLINHLETELNEYKAKSIEHQNLLKELDENSKKEKARLKLLEDIRERHLMEVRVSEEEIVTLLGKLSNANAEKISLKSEKESLRKQLAKLQESKAAVASETAKELTETDMNTCSITEIEEVTVELQHRIEVAVAKQEEGLAKFWNEALPPLESRLAALKQWLENVQSTTMDMASQKYAALEAQWKEEKTKYESLKAQVEAEEFRTREASSVLQLECDKLTEEKENLLIRLGKAENEQQKLKEDKEKLERKLEKMEENEDKLEDDLRNIEIKYKTLEQDYDKLEAENKKLITAQAKLKEENPKLRSRIKTQRWFTLVLFGIIFALIYQSYSEEIHHFVQTNLQKFQ